MQVEEIIAREIAADIERGIPKFTQQSWDQLTSIARITMLVRARAVLAALDAAGYVVAFRSDVEFTTIIANRNEWSPEGDRMRAMLAARPDASERDDKMTGTYDHDLAMRMLISEPAAGWRKLESFDEPERLKLRPIAETLAMLDGNAFFGMPKGEAEHFWADQYLSMASALYEANGGDGGWAGEASFVRPDASERGKT